MAVGPSICDMGSALSRREDEAAGFDRSGPQQHVPMGATGELGEGSGNRKKACALFRQYAVKLRKAQVIADAQPQRTPGQRSHHHLFSWLEGLGLPVVLAVGDVDVEHVNLVIARRDRTLGAEE